MEYPTTISDRNKQLQEGFDEHHEARSRSDFHSKMYAQAMGDEFPRELNASSSCDWSTLGAVTGRLRMYPGGMLADLGCGSGGIGLWLARALSSYLVGIDISPSAVRIATERRGSFAMLARAHFKVGTLERSGLPSETINGIVCIDALSFASSNPAALKEMERILVPGGRAVVTKAFRKQTSTESWKDQVAEAGLTVENEDERPNEPEMWRRLYRLWIENEAELHKHLGSVQTKKMLKEATDRLPHLDNRRAFLMTLRKPQVADR